MSILLFVIVWFLSVLLMTIFSALWTHFSGNEFREPQLLSKILNDAFPRPSSYLKAGWFLHLLFGAVFLGMYEILWIVTGWTKTLSKGIILGSILGVVGIIGWIALFKLPDFNKTFKYGQYYLHIFFAHLVFSLTALFSYRNIIEII